MLLLPIAIKRKSMVLLACHVDVQPPYLYNALLNSHGHIAVHSVSFLQAFPRLSCTFNPPTKLVVIASYLHQYAL